MIDSIPHQFQTPPPAPVAPESGPYMKRQELFRELMSDGELLLKNRLEVRHLMTREPVVIPPTITLEEMTDLMRRRRLHHLLVCGRGGELIGVVSDHDLCSARGATAQQLMSYPPLTCTPDTPLNAAITFLINENVSCLPVVGEGRLLGVLTVTDLVLTLQCMLQLWLRLAQVVQHDQTWTDELSKIASSLEGEKTAAQLAEKIAAAQQAIRRQVESLLSAVDLGADALTGVSNRRGLEDVLDVLLGVKKRFGRPFSMAVAVIDYFDRIRASCGDDVVRPLLKALARLIEESADQGDFVARWRDDAFAVVLPETGLDDAQEFCRRLQEAVRGSAQLDVELRLSVGAVEAEPTDDVSQLLARAESAV